MSAPSAGQGVLSGTAVPNGTAGAVVRQAAALWCLTALLASILYIATSDGQPQWQDSGEMQVRILTNEMHHLRGLVLTHPLHFYLGRLSLWIMPGLEPALAITIGTSAIPSAIGLANMALALWILTRRLLAVLPPALALLLAHTYWRHATVTECYGVSVVLLSGEWIALALYVTRTDARWLIPMALCNGLGVSNHLLAGLATPIDAVLVLLAVRRGKLPAGLALVSLAVWVLGVLPYAWVAFEHWREHGDLLGTLRSATVGHFAGEVTNVRIGPAELLRGVGYIVYNFPGLTIPLALAGLWWRDASRVVRGVLAAELLIFLLFAIRYRVNDAYAFFFPVYMVLTLLAGLGLERLARSWTPRAMRLIVAAALLTALWTPLVYWAATEVVRSLGLLRALVQNKPYRDGYQTFFLPWGCAKNHGRALNEAVARLAGEDGLVIVEDDVVLHGLRYGKVTGMLAAGVIVQRFDLFHPSNDDNDDLEAIRLCVRRYWQEGRPVVLVPRDRDAPLVRVPGATWARRGDVYCLEHYADPPPEHPG